MTKDILNRVAASLRPNSRLPDCKRTLTEAETEHAGLEVRIAEADRNASNPSVPDEDARQAVERSNDFRLYQRRLARGIDELRAVVKMKEDARRSEERMTAYAAAKEARDALTMRWDGPGRSAYALLMRLFADTRSNDQAIARANRMLPEGAECLRSAEVEARSSANEARWRSGDEFTRLTSLDWHNFDRPGFAWSPREAERREIAASINADGARIAAAAAAREAANTPQALAAKAAAEAERVKRYLVSQIRYSGGMVTGVRHARGVSGVDNEPVPLWMDERQVRAAEKLGLKVEIAPLKDKPRVDDGKYLRTLGREYADSGVALQVSQL